MRRMYPLLAAVLLAVLLAGCGAKSNTTGASDVPNTLPSAGSPDIVPTVGEGGEATHTSGGAEAPSEQLSAKETQLKETAQEVVEYLRERDLNSLVPFIDPKLGLRFSPYSHVNKDTDLVFTPDTLPSFKDATKQVWGTNDGSGDPIELSFRDYYEKFVYNKDFADAPNISVNKLLGKGNTEFNVTDAYPNASYVEYYFPGSDKDLGGMDWQSLILVFDPEGDDWRLTGIMHGQWTI
ncbi:hypothetical protein [Cohnella terricola]|uniref:DUF4309 domain-containing protein n=1 Tax=Cohnella terricola TaxID=1289167 RepID=A0A559JB80_9BACL|nr:hypothetical protein [Cohnella terricola]TVX97136.1 hypothetical protein FPZ45_19505 [Cohnella terricola]